MLLVSATLAALILGATASSAFSQARPAAEEATGLKVGAPAPKFTLKDQSGAERRLDEFLGKGKVALVFYRSADW
jgi:cytochrome oxidase Cu insertion factor (SCO1/SenC/PrrC family)